ncbi:MAG: tetratricopeptide repeat protein [Chloroflexota bacterium]
MTAVKGPEGMLTVLVNSRISGNDNWGLLDLLEDFRQKSASHRNFEVCVKFDDDDPKVPEVLPKLTEFPFVVKYLVEPRGRGYEDMHQFMYRTFSIADRRSVAVGVVSDDFFVAVEGWDEAMLSKCHQWDDDIFVMHGEPHRPHYRNNVLTHKFWPFADLRDIDLLGADISPWWSRRWVEICGGFGPTWSCDSWIMHLEWELYHVYGIERTAFLDQPVFGRKMNPRIDLDQGERWHGVRKRTHDYFQTDFYRTMVQQEARNLALNILAGDLVEARAKVWGDVRLGFTDQDVLNREMNLGTAALIAGQGEAAFRIFRRLAERFPSVAVCHASLGLTLLRSGRPTEAVGPLGRACELAPGDANVHGNYGVALFLAGDRRRGEEELQAALALDPGNLNGCLNLVALLRDRGQPADALEALSRLARCGIVDPRVAELTVALEAEVREAEKVVERVR